MAIADYLRKLVELKNQLVANLNSMGVVADENEKLNTLVPKVLQCETNVIWSKGTVTIQGTTSGEVYIYIKIPEGVKSIGDNGCTGCKSVTIPDSVKSIGSQAFYYGLFSSITLPDGLTSIGDEAFYYCTSLSSITIPNSVTDIGIYTFTHCTSLGSITLSDSMTSIPQGMFDACTSLQSITIPDGVTSIGRGAFVSCTALTKITLPDGVTSIGESAFQDDEYLSYIIIPDSVTNIDTQAFYYCTRLKNIYYTGTQEQWNAITKGSGWNTYMGSNVSGTTIHYNYVPE